MAINRCELLHPTYCSESVIVGDIEQARTVATRVLHEIGMADFSVSAENVTIWQGYFLFSYFLMEEPKLAHGGGAALVVRRSDCLGGLVYGSSDWLEPDIDQRFANIPKAYANYDNAKE